MASFSLLTINTPFLQKTPQLSSLKKPTYALGPAPSCSKKVSCNTTNNIDDAFQLIQIRNPNTKTELLDRRNLLVGLGGMYGAAITLGGAPTNTLAAPIAPDVRACTLTDAQWDGSVGDHCCPPKFDPSQIVDFELKKCPVVKVRRPAHKAMEDPTWLADYKRATAIMKSLPISDPRSFLQQARVHCAYCDGAYPVLNDKDHRYEVHAGSLFASFHRWYLYFYERILAKLINKPDFALPYWNWDHPDGMGIPAMFNDIDSPLYDPNRNENHLKSLIDLSYDTKSKTEHGYPDEQQIQENLLLMRKQMLYVTKHQLFFGKPYKTGDNKGADTSGTGSLEFAPHNNIHVWTGSLTVKQGQDMGSFWSAARDPIFYCHHSNVDRMWSIWCNDLPGVRSNYPDKEDDRFDYLNSYFIFYDENAKPVRVYVKDSLDTEELGYRYEHQDLPWLFRPILKPNAAVNPPKIKITDKTVTFPKPLDSVIKTKLVRPRKSRTKLEKEKEEEVLVIDLELGMSSHNQFIKFDVYINDEYDHKPEERTRINEQYAGSFTSLAHRGGGNVVGRGMEKKSALKLGINRVLEDINASDDDAIQVTIVPKSGTEGLVITNVKIDFVA